MLCVSISLESLIFGIHTYNKELLNHKSFVQYTQNDSLFFSWFDFKYAEYINFIYQDLVSFLLFHLTYRLHPDFPLHNQVQHFYHLESMS